MTSIPVVSPELLDALADQIVARLVERLPGLAELSEQAGAASDRWLTTREAAEYLGLSVAAVHKLTAARQIPFEQDGPGCKCWFRRDLLDRWRAS